MIEHATPMIITCAVCHGDRRDCQHDADEWYDALIAEQQRHINTYVASYRRLYEWYQRLRKDRTAMKQRIKELEAKNNRLEARLWELQDNAASVNG